MTIKPIPPSRSDDPEAFKRLANYIISGVKAGVSNMAVNPATLTYEQALARYVETVYNIHVGHYAQNLSNLTAPTFEVQPGRSFDKIVSVRSSGSKSVHSFVAKVDGSSKAIGPRKQGDIMMAAGWKAPAKHPRGTIFGEVHEALTAHGSIRYLK